MQASSHGRLQVVVDVRRATVDDAPALARLRWAWRVDEHGEQAASLDEFADRFRAWMVGRGSSHEAFIATDGADAVGMAWLAVVTRVPGPEVWLRLAGVVQSVYVVPAHRGAGIGGRLVGAVIERARGLSLDYLSVHPSERSFPVYRRLGFTDTSGVLELSLSR